MQPKLLILDQAFSRLTPEASHTLLRQIRHYSELSGCSVILLEQRLFPAAHYCEQFVLLDHGRQLARGELEQVLVKGAKGYVLMTHAGPDSVLTALCKPNSRLGLIFLDVKRAADAISKVI